MPLRSGDEGTTEARIGLTAAEFLVIFGQLAVVLGIAWLFRIEVDRGFVSLAPIILGGFAIHAWLPLRYRLPFFVMMTVFGAVVLLGPVLGMILVGIVLGIFGICHLPLPHRARVALVLMVGAVLGGAIAGVWEWEATSAIVPIVGAIFMFRLILYLYDMATENSSATVWQRVAYFLQLPNLVFPLYPVIDYQTWLGTYYGRDAREIYQKGLTWILRGLYHLLLYRIVYHMLPRVDEFGGPLGVLVLGAFTYGLYLRVSGLFHLITGILCMFGFDLPTTHHKYFLASGFNDLWRRANIYFKDFMMKTMFYPIVHRTRRWGMARSMGVAALLIGIASWQLHAYQWFWLLGVYQLSWVDAIFWLGLGAGMTVNTVLEARRGRKRRLGQGTWSFRDAVGLSVRTLLFFITLSQMWLLWDVGSVQEWTYRASRVGEGSAGDWALTLAVLTAVVGIGTLSQFVTARGWTLRRFAEPSFGNLAGATATAGVAILLVGIPQIQTALGHYPDRVIAKAKSTELNRIDKEREVKGYYETLTRAVRFSSPLWDLQMGEGTREEWYGENPARSRDDYETTELTPNNDVVYKGAPLSTNRLGMRDRDYAVAKPPGTVRLAFLGGSYVMGPGVAADQVYDDLVERELNRAQDGPRYEVMNFSVPNTAAYQVALMTRRRLPAFQPDVIYYFAGKNEHGRLLDRLAVAHRSGRKNTDPLVEEILRRARVDSGMTESEYRLHLQPFSRALLVHAYELIVSESREMAAVPVWMYLPDTRSIEDPATVERFADLARDAGFHTYVLDPYRDVAEEDLGIAPWDSHPNARAHQLIQRELIDLMESDPVLLGQPGSPARPAGQGDPIRSTSATEAS